MLPKDKHQQNRLRRLKLFKGDKHQYAVELGLNKKEQ
jgi:ribosomal protein L13